MNFSQYVKNEALVLSKTTINISELVGFLQSNVHITQLSLRHCGVGDQGAEALANGNLSHLTSLDLCNNKIGDKGAKALAKLTNLTKLDLGSNYIRYKGAEKPANFTKLAKLDLGNNNIRDEGAIELAKLTNLTELYLRGNNIRDRGAKELAKLTNLTKLDLYGNNIRDEGAKELAKLTNLTKLDLGGNYISDKVVEALTKLTGLSLNLEGNKKGVLMPYSKKSKSNEANNQGAKQQGAQIQFDQRQKPNAQATSTHPGCGENMLTRGTSKPEQVSSGKTNPEINETLEGLPKKLENVNPNLLRTLLERGIIWGGNEINKLFGTQEKVDRLNNIELDLLQILINRNFIRDSNGLSKLLNDEDFITNAKNNPSLTKTLLNMDGVASSVIGLVRHPKYIESSGHLIRNCKLALALSSKGAIKDITIDYLLDSEKIKNDLKGNEFINNTIVCYMLDGVFTRSENNMEGNPISKLKDLSLEAFVKTMPQIS